MNDIFNIRRFGKYFTADARSCVANFGLSMLLISLMGLIVYAGTIIMGLIIKGQWDGPALGFRIFTLIVCLIVLTLTMPVKCYGKITEKKYGTQWLMVPASSLEKTLSMILMNAIVIPAAVCLVYLGVDSILCVMDGTCGTSIAGSMKSVLDRFLEISVASESDISQFPALAHFIKQVSCPLLYVDDIIQMFLITLLGAVLFKKGKTSQTILFFIAITTVLGLTFIPISNVVFREFAAMNFEANTPEAMNQLFGMGPFKHAVLLDTVSDTLINFGLMTATYFRIKTLKH